MSLYLNVPFEEKDEAKTLGAIFDGEIKKWKFNGIARDFVKFSKWIQSDAEFKKFDGEGGIIALNEFYIVQGYRTCYKCKNKTRIIGLGCSDYVRFSKRTKITQNIQPIYDFKNHVDSMDILVFWVEKEESIPPLLRDYLSKEYGVRMTYSATVRRKYLANVCEHCNALQGNNFVYDDDCELLYNNPIMNGEEGLQLYRVFLTDAVLFNDVFIVEGYAGTGKISVPMDYVNLHDLKIIGSEGNRKITYKQMQMI